MKSKAKRKSVGEKESKSESTTTRPTTTMNPHNGLDVSSSTTTPLSQNVRDAVLLASTTSTADKDTSNTTASASFSIQHCLVCYNDLQEQPRAITPCNHNDICGTCHLRLRYLHQDKRCPICKQENERVIVDFVSTSNHQQKSFEEYPMWGEDYMGADFVFRAQPVGMFFPTEYYERTIRPLFGYHCTVKGCPYDGTITSTSPTTLAAAAFNAEKGKNTTISNINTQQLRALQDHLRTQHRLVLCQLCVDHQRDFVANLPRYTPHQLQQHLQNTPNNNNNHTTTASKNHRSTSVADGHPLCEFCRPTRFYDLTALHQHLHKEHYQCHVCQEALGLPNQFFKNYRSLERHFDKEHFLCHDVQCLQARFVVFGTELDLRHHERTVHGATSTGDTKVQLEFRVRRRPGEIAGGGGSEQQQQAPSASDFQYTLDGQVFVPPDLPQSSNQDRGGSRDDAVVATLHPLHVQRTQQLRQRAEALRVQQQQELESQSNHFPSLHAESNGQEGQQQQQQLRVGWATGATVQRVGAKSKAVGQITEESFPALVSQKQKKVSAATAKLKTTTAAQRQFAAMSHTANTITASSTPGWGRPLASASTGSTDNHMPSVGLSNMNTSSSSSSQNNKTINLDAENFPSLGSGGGGASQQHSRWERYDAAEALVAARNNRPSSSSTNAITPRLDSLSDFPAPPVASNKSSVRDRLLSDTPSRRPQPSNDSYGAFANVLRGSTGNSSTVVTIDDMKVSLGKTKYKELKRLTSEFAQGNLGSDAYVDMAAALFDKGYGDPDFWQFLPALLQSCPNEYSSQQALAYMDNLKRMRNGAMNAESLKAAAAVAAAAPLTTSSQWSAAVGTRTVATTASHRPHGTGGIVSAGQDSKNAWNGTASSSAARANQNRPGTVVAATPQQSSSKKQYGNDRKKKNNKQKNELRQLAFGS